jgi:hypothetical protein
MKSRKGWEETQEDSQWEGTRHEAALEEGAILLLFYYTYLGILLL